jgi:LacI family transcriptional regulator
MTSARAEEAGRKPTIRDVAERAGVSIGTVSNVLNGAIPVSDRRRDAVTEAIDALGYVPNSLAQSLRRRTSRVVGLLATGTSSAYFAALLDAFEDIAARQGYEVMQVLSRAEPELELRRVRALVSRKVDGLIMVPTAAPERAYDLIAEAGLPAVVVDRASADPRFDYVTMDNREAMDAAVRRLAGRGHRRLLYIVRWPELVTTRERIAAFRAAAGELGIAGEVIRREPDDAGFLAQLGAVMAGPSRPSAIVASNSDLTLALLRALKSLGLAIPRDVSVLAFDEPVWAEVLTPPLAVVRHPVEAIARSAWEILIRRMETGAPASRRVVHAAEVVLRDSIATLPTAIARA